MLKLPWNGVVLSGCIGIRYNGGLYTQCGVECVSASASLYCSECERSNRLNGLCVYGSMSERLSSGIMSYKDSRGRSPIMYSKYMSKMGFSREEVELEGLRCGIKVLECHFVEVERKRGRPRKEKVEVEKKKRGRPRKEKEMVSNIAGEELIASLLDGMVDCRSSNEVVVSEGGREEVVVSEGGREEVVVREGGREEVVVREGGREEWVVREGGREEWVVSEIKVSEIEECEDWSSNEEIEVVRFELKGKKYLRSKENILYDIDSHDAIGIWNEASGEIDELEEED